jgi:hypothetical protein
LLTRADLLDIIVEAVARSGRAPDCGVALRPAATRRVFLSDWELRRMRVPGARTMKVPRGSLISPLSRDWLDYEGVKIEYC